jgi:hypothetical protein
VLPFPSPEAYVRPMQRTGPLFLLAAAIGCARSGSAPDAASDVPVIGEGSFSWSEAAPCPVARFEASGVVVDGELWVMGGFLSSNLEVTPRVDIYAPGTDSWRLGSDLPGAQTHFGVVSRDSEIILVGGFDGDARAWSTTRAVWRWQGDAAGWIAGPGLPAPRAAVAAGLVGTVVHAAGGLADDGNTDSGDHVAWDLAGEPGWTSAAPLPNPRNHGGGAASGGLFFAIAGRRGWDEVAGDLTSVDAFDPATGAWTGRAPLPIERSEIGASTLTLSDGRLLVIGGSVAGVHPSADVFVYDPALDAWGRLPSLPARRKGAVAARIGASIVVTTGSPTSTDPAATTFIGCCL